VKKICAFSKVQPEVSLIQKENDGWPLVQYAITSSTAKQNTYALYNYTLNRIKSASKAYIGIKLTRRSDENNLNKWRVSTSCPASKVGHALKDLEESRCFTPYFSTHQIRGEI
jgi:hypothetical protein